MKSKPVVSVNKVDERYTIVVKNGDHTFYRVVSQGSCEHHLCEAFTSQHEQLQDIRVELSREQKKLKHYQYGAESSDVVRVTNNTEVRATPLTSNDTTPRMPRANAEPILEVGEKVLSKSIKPRVRVLPAHQRFIVTKGAGAISARGGIVYAVNKTSPKLWWVHWANYNPSWENCESLYISDPSFRQVKSRDNEQH